MAEYSTGSVTPLQKWNLFADKGSCSTKQQITTSPLGSEKVSSKLKRPFSLFIPIQPTTLLGRDSNNPQLQDIERLFFMSIAEVSYCF
jgi:hypothetical protein